MAKVKAAMLGATPISTLTGKLQPGRPVPDVSAATAVAAAVSLPGETLRATVERHTAAVADAQADLRAATLARRNAPYTDRRERMNAENRCRQALQDAEAARLAAVTILEAGEVGERVAQSTATLAKLSYAKDELARFQSELGKLVAPGERPV